MKGTDWKERLDKRIKRAEEAAKMAKGDDDNNDDDEAMEKEKLE